MHPHTQYRGFTPGWYAVPRWGTPINHRRPYPGLAGHSNESSTFSSRVSEAATFGIAQRGNAYQPRATPWDSYRRSQKMLA